MNYNIVLGSTGLVGKAFYEYLEKNKKFIFFNKKSLVLLRNYLKNSTYEKKM